MVRWFFQLLVVILVWTICSAGPVSSQPASEVDVIEPIAWGSYSGNSGSSAGEFHSPDGLAVDSSGNLYVVDSFNKRIQVFDDQGNFLRHWKVNGHIKGIALDGEGFLYAPVWAGYVLKFDLEGNEVLRWGKKGRKPGEFQSPTDIAIDRNAKRIYVVDVNKSDIQTFSYSGQFMERWDCWKKISPKGVALDSDGNLLVTDSFRSCIYKISNAGVQLEVWNHTEVICNGLLRPSGITVGPGGVIFVSDTSTNQIHKLDSNGNTLKCWGKLGSENGDFCEPTHLAIAPDHTIYISDHKRNHRIQRFSLDGEFVKKMGKSSPSCDSFIWPASLAISESGDLYATDSDQVKQFDIEGNLIRCWGGLGESEGKLNDPIGVAVFGDRVFVVDSKNNRVQVFDDSGVFVRSWGEKGEAKGEFHHPTDISIDELGNIFVLDWGNRRIQQFNTAGLFLGEFKTPGGAHGLAVDSEGAIYVSSRENHSVRKYDYEGNVQLEWGGEGKGKGEFSHPAGISIGDDSTVYVVDFENSRIQRFDNRGVFVEQYGTLGSGVGELRRPKAVACWGRYVFVADSNNRRIQRFHSKFWEPGFLKTKETNNEKRN